MRKLEHPKSDRKVKSVREGQGVSMYLVASVDMLQGKKIYDDPRMRLMARVIRTSPDFVDARVCFMMELSML